MKRATVAVLACLGAVTLVPSAALAMSTAPNQQSGWKRGQNYYDGACGSSIFYGTNAASEPYAFGRATNPNCLVVVEVRTKIFIVGKGLVTFPVRSDPGYPSVGTVGHKAPAQYASLTTYEFRLLTFIPGFGVYSTSTYS